MHKSKSAFLALFKTAHYQRLAICTVGPCLGRPCRFANQWRASGDKANSPATFCYTNVAIYLAHI